MEKSTIPKRILTYWDNFPEESESPTVGSSIILKFTIFKSSKPLDLIKFEDVQQSYVVENRIKQLVFYSQFRDSVDFKCFQTLRLGE